MITELLGWCTLINYGILTFWFLMFVFAHDFVYNLHRRWFRLSVEKLDSIHYAGMAFYKIAIFIFNLAPYIALKIVS